MFSRSLLRQAARVAAPARPLAITARNMSVTPFMREQDKPIPEEKGEHVGSFSRTDNSIEIPFDEKTVPSQEPVQGRGGFHFQRTLASFTLEGKTAIVTGGARGLGLVMAQALVVSGADVALVDLNKEEAEKQAKELVKVFKDENPGADRVPKVTGHYCDVSDEHSVESVLSDVINQHGKIDNLVTSAGFTENFDAVKYPIDRVRKLWGVNVDGTYLFATGVARHLMERKAPGSIVFIGSMSGAIVNVPQPQAPYNASKAAVRHLGRSLAVEWAHANIRVNVIEPGYMLTALTEKILNENPELGNKWTSLIPQGKMGRPVDLMGPVVFLCSDASNYVTGADLRVDGGYTCT
ncbi:NAD(P)-binding protein [Aureobasidium sp. EXF-8846]|nr:NAD(P)-binding protein [Aureobasidium sp. EXF-8846]